MTSPLMVLPVSCLDLQDLTFLLPLTLRQIGLPQAFASHLFVEYPLALAHHEESFASMHCYVWMRLHCRCTGLQEQASFARRYPNRTVGRKDCSPQLAHRQLLHTHFFCRVLLLLLPAGAPFAFCLFAFCLFAFCLLPVAPWGEGTTKSNLFLGVRSRSVSSLR